MLVYTTGTGVNGFTFDPSIEFSLSHPNMRTPSQGAIYSVNEGNLTQFKNLYQTILNFASLKTSSKEKKPIVQDILDL